MNTTPIALVGNRNPDIIKDIKKISEKWEKRTKGLEYPWPKGGTFDVAVCESMDTRIKDHKHKDHSKKRSGKRKLELKILKLFNDEGQYYRAKMRQGLRSLQKYIGKEKGQENNHLNVSEIAGLYPNLDGWLRFNCNVTESPAEETSQIIGNDKPKHEDKTPTPKGDRGSAPKSLKDSPPNTSGSLKSTKVVIAEKQEEQINGKTAHSTDTKTSTTAKILNPKHCSTARKVRRSMPAVLDCYEGRKSVGREHSYSYWLDLPSTGIDLRRELNRSVIMEMEKEIDKQAAELRGGEEDEDEEEELKINLRNRALFKKPNRYNNEQYMAPILIKGTQGHYIPWQTLDLTGLVSGLPDIHVGASKWIRAFEEATVGKLLALGDLKAVWAKTLGVSAMETMLKNNGCEWMISPMADGTELDAYRGTLWAALRREYPTRVDHKALRGAPLTETDDPATYISNQLKRWKQETEEDIERSLLLTGLFRDSVIDALPIPVQSRLRDVVGLTTMPHRQFCDNVIHVVDRHRKDEWRVKEQDREVQRKLAQLQLSELQSKNKVKSPSTEYN